MTLKEIKTKAKGRLGYCVSCEECDGRACSNMIPGPGAIGNGTIAIKNFEAWKKYSLEIDPIVEKKEIDTSFEFFGKKFALPIFAGSISNIRLHYSKLYTEEKYYEILFTKCVENGITAFTGDSIDETVFDDSLKAVKKVNGLGIPTIKPWDDVNLKNRLNKVNSSGAFAVAMDLDAIGSPFLQVDRKSVQSYSVEELKNVISATSLPFIVKGVMNLKVAKKAIEVGAKAIVVSNHGGRVLDDMPATAEVLKEICDFAKGKCKILVDGGIRTGRDVFKALALGADAVLIARPFVQVIFGDEENGVKTYVDYLANDFKYAMHMCGARNLSDICFDMIRVNR